MSAFATETPDLREIVGRLGGDLYRGGRGALIPGPGHSRKDRSLSLTITDGNPPRLLWKSWANDPGEVVWPYLGVGRQSARPMTSAEAQRARRERERVRQSELAIKLEFCRGIWSETQEAAGSPVETYLRSRAITGPIPAALRFHPAAPLGYPDPSRPLRTYPAMVAIVTGPDGKSAAGLHVTSLLPDGSGKANLANARRMFGDMAGAAVQLSPFPTDGVLAIGEGIESALSFRDLNGTPTWAALSTSLMRIFSPPAGVKRLVIAADADDQGDGLKAARDLAERASRRCDCVLMPPPAGMDWNDVLKGGGQ